MRAMKTESFKKRLEPRLMEHFDAYVLVGYSADRHQKVVESNFGGDASCRDGLRIMETVAERWLDGSMFPGKRQRKIDPPDDSSGVTGKDPAP